jgi:cytoskeletal protein RodZ
MQEIPDNELDNLFRKSAEEYMPEFDPEAWRKMKKKLDESESRGGAWWRLLLLCLVGLLPVLIWTGYKMTDYGNKNQVDKASQDTNQLSITRVDVAQPDSSEVKREQPRVQIHEQESEAVHEVSTSSTPAISNIETAQPHVKGPNANDNASAIKNKTISASNDGQNTDLKKVNAKRKEVLTNANPGKLTAIREQKHHNHGKPEAEKAAEMDETLVLPVISDTGNTQEQEALPGEVTPVEPSISVISLENEAGQRQKELVRLAPKPVQVKYVEVELPEIPGPAPVNEEGNMVISPRKVGDSRSRFGIRAVLSPDLSSVGLFHFEMPGTNVGLLVEYRLSNRLQLQTGVIHSIKNYSATAENYAPTYWKYIKVKPTSINGVCKMIDLPLNLRYNVLNGTRHDLFMTGGLTSYIMLSEKYKYKYAIEDPDLRKSWSGKRGGEYYFSVANFSLGYERQFLPGFTWQVEPFIKVPLGRVGYGKVKLISAGVFLSAKYQLPFNKSHIHKKK